MPVVVVTPPAPVVTFDEVEKHLSDVPSEDREYVEALTAAATAWIDGPAGWLGRSVGPQLLEWSCDEPSSVLRLPYGPVLEIVAAWAGDDPVDPEDGSPITRARYWAGYGKRDPEDATKWIVEAPSPIKVAIMMLVAQWYNTRENVITGTIASAMPFAADALLFPYRVRL